MPGEIYFDTLEGHGTFLYHELTSKVYFYPIDIEMFFNQLFSENWSTESLSLVIAQEYDLDQITATKITKDALDSLRVNGLIEDKEIAS